MVCIEYLSIMYKYGFGVLTDYSKSMELLEKGNMNNDPKTLYQTSLFHLDGLNMKKNIKLAKSLLKMSSDLGYFPATAILKFLFFEDKKEQKMKFKKEEDLANKYTNLMEMVDHLLKAIKSDENIKFNNQSFIDFIENESYILKNMFIKINERKGKDQRQFYNMIRVSKLITKNFALFQKKPMKKQLDAYILKINKIQSFNSINSNQCESWYFLFLIK
jgi:hypothetical protein